MCIIYISFLVIMIFYVTTLETIKLTAPVVTPQSLFFVYLAVLQSWFPSRRLVLMFPAGRHSDTQSPSAAAARCSGRVGSDRDAPPPGTPLWLFSGGASSNRHTPLPSPAHTEDAAGKQVDSSLMWIHRKERNTQNTKHDKLNDHSGLII